MSAASETLERPVTYEPALTWLCAFCGKLRVYEGSRRLGLSYLDDCARCGSRIATTAKDRVAVAKVVTIHLI